MRLYTQVAPAAYDYSITSDASGLIVGSCFASALAERLLGSGLRVEYNPQGVLYNPLSIACGVEMLRSGLSLNAADLELRDGLWHSFAHHGSFSAPTPDQVLDKTNRSLIDHFDYIVLTLGTAYIYERHGQVVANCHKFPDREFTRRRMSLAQAVEALRRVRAAYPEAYILLTVSPIRHTRDGLAENSVSKATLRLACDEFCASDTRSGYFPSYEIMIDELRDYRFYAADMLHPSPLAVDMIFERFAAALLSPHALQMVSEGRRAAKTAAHIPLNH